MVPTRFHQYTSGTFDTYRRDVLTYGVRCGRNAKKTKTKTKRQQSETVLVVKTKRGGHDNSRERVGNGGEIDYLFARFKTDVCRTSP